MKKIALFSLSLLLFSGFVSAQVDTLPAVPQNPPAPRAAKMDLSGRANDHLLIQVGYAGWSGTPDTINTGGFSRSLNVYFMFDFPFKTNPRLSMAFGPGIASDNIKFKKTFVDIKSNNATLPFVDQADTNHFKKTKLTTVYAELPVEFRYTANPLNSDRSFKFALGLKVGTMINAHTRNKTLQNASGNTINDYLLKEGSKKFFNTTRFSGMARIGWGHFTLFGSYQFTNLFKEGVAAEIRPYTIGLTLSGL